MSSEHHFLDVIFLKDQIQEAIDIMREWQEKKADPKAEQWIEGYCQGLQYATKLAHWLSQKGEINGSKTANPKLN